MPDSYALPTATLYRYYDESGRLLYVGITGRGHKRTSAHGRGAWWWPLVARAEFFHADTWNVRLAERLAIWTERPLGNIADRVSTAERQRMLAEVAANEDHLGMSAERACQILRLSEKEIKGAIRLGFLEADYRPLPRTFSRKQIETFIGQEDIEPFDRTVLAGRRHDELVPRKP